MSIASFDLFCIAVLEHAEQFRERASAASSSIRKVAQVARCETLR
jgi:hypothetical protein